MDSQRDDIGEAPTRSRLLSRWREMTRFARAGVLACTALLALVVVWGTGSAVAAGAFECTGCHAMEAYARAHSESTHSGLGCRECHTGTGAVAALVNAPRALGWMGASVFGVQSAPVDTSDASCRSCHDAVLTQTVESGGLRVRHADFVESTCHTCHPGTGHVLAERHYVGTQMSDCTSCHRSSALLITSCEVCHIGKGDRAVGESSWRVVHGAGWKQTHGAGELEGCTDCHTPSYCARCHGIPMPHPAEWPNTHGATALESAKPCRSCHEADWCSSCHGIEMPHPDGFWPAHPAEVKRAGAETCHRCHSIQTCERCHVSSSHPVVPGVRSDAHGAER